MIFSKAMILNILTFTDFTSRHEGSKCFNNKNWYLKIG